MGYYTFYDNTCRPYSVQEPPLEPLDCWGEGSGRADEEEYDRGEDEANGVFNRR